MTPEVRTPEDLLRNTPHIDIADSTHPNPLAVPDYLEEAMLSDVWILLVESVVGMLFDLRMAPGFTEQNAAVLVLHDLPKSPGANRTVGPPASPKQMVRSGVGGQH